MAVEEIFSKLSTHMARGIKMHNHMALLFGFLNLNGYQKQQEYHYYEEIHNYKQLQNFFLSYYKKIIIEDLIVDIKVIPQNWYKYNKNNVDSSSRYSAIKDIMKTWIKWQQDTKELLEASYKQLQQLGQIHAMLKISQFIKQVCEQLRQAEQKQINFEIISYDMVSIIEEQQHFYKKYSKKIKQIF